MREATVDKLRMHSGLDNAALAFLYGVPQKWKSDCPRERDSRRCEHGKPSNRSYFKHSLSSKHHHYVNITRLRAPHANTRALSAQPHIVPSATPPRFDRSTRPTIDAIFVREYVSIGNSGFSMIKLAIFCLCMLVVLRRLVGKDFPHDMAAFESPSFVA
ncbi:hypothetical protein V1524DRAFT_408363 [Lipomyces starkeyi]